ncbi:MAG TPA: amidohydrolase family protein [Bryobacteraceae bacterium]|nr:amidohydrolase family protein [Bryobacteraceae bacterium]
MRLDSHVCFTPGHPPEHLQAILARNRFDGAILLVDGPTLPPTGPHIAGILVRPEHLGDHGSDPRFRGVCAPIASVTPALAEKLARDGVALDLEMRTGDFPALLRLAENTPGLRVAIDHMARPAFNGGVTDEWRRGMESAARLPNVFCKISGLLTEVAQLPWSAAPIRPFVQHSLAVFGPRRLMFGSEWPVRLPDITWKESLAVFTQSIGAQPMEVRERLLGGTAAAFYGI